MEQLLYELALADANCGMFSGGFTNEAWNIYHKLLDSIDKYEIQNVIQRIIVSHCYIGLTRISLYSDQPPPPKNGEEEEEEYTAERYARLSVQELEAIEDNFETTSLYLWNKSILNSSIQYHKGLSRQLLSDALLQNGKLDQAKQLLQEAIRDSPNDASIVFSYSAFLLREVLLLLLQQQNNATAPSLKDIKTVQTHLLKAAKLGSSAQGAGASNPFALLGIWYEVFQPQDKKRIMGCYSKSLLLDPANPIAGRGILRLTMANPAAAQKILDQAVTNTTTTNNNAPPLNGWAWYAIGKHKIMQSAADKTGDASSGVQQDEFAVIAFLKALRCLDIEQPQQDSLSFFYHLPTTAAATSFYSLSCIYQEKADILAHLAMCYRRLGRYTASIRSFNASMEAALVVGTTTSGSTDNDDDVNASELVLLSPFVLCSCAQVELELGLLDEAANKFMKAIEIINHKGESNTGSNSSILSIASHGQGLALLEISRREMLCGKAGSAYSILKQAIDGCLLENNESSDKFLCTQKLLGDLYTYGASLPPDVFCNNDENNDNDNTATTASERLNAQISFVQKGEEHYRTAIGKTNQLLLPTNNMITSGTSEEEEEANVLRATLITDIGANILLQGQLLSMSMTSMSSSSRSTPPGPEQEKEEIQAEQQAVLTIYERAANEFKRAIEEWCPIYAPAWCGLGCAVSKIDPLLAQHAFCRAIQLDNMFPDSYANLSFLYTTYEAFQSSESILDALTQIADTPMMWINRALIFERNAAFDLVKNNSKKSTPNDNEKAAKQKLAQAVDAYRAALQVVRHPSAMLGLATTCRVSSSTTSAAIENRDTIASQMARKESYDYTTEYLGFTSSSDVAASLLAGVMTLEKGLRVHNSDNTYLATHSETLLGEGKKIISMGDEKLKQMQFKIANERKQKGGRENLDLELIEKCLLLAEQRSSLKQQEEETKNETITQGERMSLSRRIMIEPDRGDLWVALTKELCRGDDIRKSKATMESAKLAAHRAVKILTHHLTHPPASSNAVSSSSSTAETTVHRRVDARDLSEALALVYWLGNLESSSSNNNKKKKKKESKNDGDGNNENDKKEVEETSGGGSSINHLALQRSLIFCPNNEFAREALKLSTVAAAEEESNN